MTTEKDPYTNLKENLGLLQRNMSQMTEEQKQKYKTALRKLKEQIAKDAEEVAKEFILMGCRFLTADFKDWEKGFIESVNKILEEEHGAKKEASRVLFKTYDIDKFLTTLCRIHYRIWYEAYAPYWLNHTSPNPMSSEYPYHNDIIDMDWWAEHNEWAKTKVEDGKMVTDYQGGVTIMIPPTEELIKQTLDEELKRLEEQKID